MPIVLNPAGLATAGFQKLPGYNDLYSHSKFPGFLFKSCATVAAAVSMGGIMFFDPDGSRQVAYLGSLRSAGLLNPGKILIVSEAMSEPLGTRCVDMSSVGGSAGIYNENIYFPFKSVGFQWTTSTEHFIGVVTKADGIVWRADKAAGSFVVGDGSSSSPTNAPELICWSAGGKGNYSVNGSLLTGMQSTTGANNLKRRVPNIGGYITIPAYIDKSTIVKDGKPAFEALIDLEDAKIKPHMLKAYDEIAATTNGIIPREVCFYVHPSGADNMVMFTDRFYNEAKSGYGQSNASNACLSAAGSVPYTLPAGKLAHKFVSFAALQMPAPSDGWIGDVSHRMGGQRIELVYDITVSGTPDNTPNSAFDPAQKVFALSHIPFTHIELGGGRAETADFLFGSMTPMAVRPASGSASVSFDFFNTVRSGLQMVDNVSGNFRVIDGSEPDQSKLTASTIASEAILARNRKAANAVLPTIDPVARFITTFTESVEKRAHELIMR